MRIVIKINIPSIEEQIKISSFISDLDKQIKLLEKKNKYLRQYKDGVSQKIFDKKIWFKNSSQKLYPEWETMKLEEVLSIAKKVKPNEVNRDKIFTVRLHLKGIHKSKNTKNLSLGATYYKRSVGQFIYGKQNLFNGAFGIVPQEFDGWLTSGDIPSFDIKTDKILPEYLIQFIGRKSYYKKLEAIASGTGSKRIHENSFLGLKIELPSMEEQLKITEFLVDIDSNIESLNSIIELTKEYKKGLLQGMFV